VCGQARPRSPTRTPRQSRLRSSLWCGPGQCAHWPRDTVRAMDIKALTDERICRWIGLARGQTGNVVLETAASGVGVEGRMQFACLTGSRTSEGPGPGPGSGWGRFRFRFREALSVQRQLNCQERLDRPYQKPSMMLRFGGSPPS
jgi:hypothetical protein